MMLRTVCLLGVLAGRALAETLPAPQSLPAAIQRQIAARETLKMKWKSGYAALMLVPVSDTGVNVCENIAFHASAPPADKAAR